MVWWTTRRSSETAIVRIRMEHSERRITGNYLGRGVYIRYLERSKCSELRRLSLLLAPSRSASALPGRGQIFTFCYIDLNGKDIGIWSWSWKLEPKLVRIERNFHLIGIYLRVHWPRPKVQYPSQVSTCLQLSIVLCSYPRLNTFPHTVDLQTNGTSHLVSVRPRMIHWCVSSRNALKPQEVKNVQREKRWAAQLLWWPA